jgi:hypothetical protein
LKNVIAFHDFGLKLVPVIEEYPVIVASPVTTQLLAFT